VALDNARLYERERAVALTLQRSLLAGDLPDDPRCAIGTHYAPAVHTLAVGGDWFDAFASGPGHLMVVVGDVVGKGLDAAATMGQVRSALKALAVAGLGPQEVLEMLDLFVDHTEQARGATIVLVEIELATGTARLACAGHPPPVLLPYGGEPELLWEGRSAPLGAYAGVRTRSEATLTLEPGARLLLYSDGVVERRDRPIDVGIEALTAAFARRRDEPVATVGSALDAELMPEQHGADDVCMLAVMFAAPPDFERRVDGDVDALPGLRADLRAWLAAHAIEGEDRDAIVLACSEVTANAIEHGLSGGAGSVRITARAADGAVALAVSDDGAWREGSTPGRGRGLAIVEHLMDDLAVERGTGTTVRMRRDLRGGR
jgi:serine/threonine-protein kinase RsbW